MGNRRNRRSRRLETPSPESESNDVQVETPSQGNITLTNFNVDGQKKFGRCPEIPTSRICQVSNEIQVWTQKHKKNTDRITKMREKMEKNAILKEIKTNKSTSITTNPR